jgi:NADH dehydrogenase (ubiquinone) Fe-S protein 5
VLACYVVNTSSEDVSGKKKCMPVLEDYYECLHHKKEVRNILPSKTANTAAPAGMELC